jgi:hypothetical protein
LFVWFVLFIWLNQRTKRGQTYGSVNLWRAKQFFFSLIYLTIAGNPFKLLRGLPATPRDVRAFCCSFTNLSSSHPSSLFFQSPKLLLVDFVYLVCLVYLVHVVSFVQANGRDRPNKRNQPDRPERPDSLEMAAAAG